MPHLDSECHTAGLFMWQSLLSSPCTCLSCCNAESSTVVLYDWWMVRQMLWQHCVAIITKLLTGCGMQWHNHFSCLFNLFANFCSQGNMHDIGLHPIMSTRCENPPLVLLAPISLYIVMYNHPYQYHWSSVMTNSLTVCGRLVIPLMPVYMLIRHRRNLNAPKVQLQLGYIYRIYRYSQLSFQY